MQNVTKSVLKRLQVARPGAGSHPDADLLTAFAEQSLKERERALVVEHLASCSDCREVIVLALSETANEIVASRASAGVARGWLTWPALRWAAWPGNSCRCLCWRFAIFASQSGQDDCLELRAKGRRARAYE